MKYPRKISFYLWRKKFQLSWKFKFAHHPLCQRYRNQVWHLGPLIVCQGCSLVLLGILSGLISSFYWLIPALAIKGFVLGLSFLIIMMPVLLVEFLRISWRPIKRLIRFLTGFGIGFNIALILGFHSFWLTIQAIVFLIGGYFLFKMVRHSRKKPDLCQTCPELSEKGVCSGYQTIVEAEREYGKIASEVLKPYLDSYLKSKYQQL